MNFDLSDDQRTIKRTARELLGARFPLSEVRRLALEDANGFTEDQWNELSGLGWPGIALPEDVGGMGLGVVELVVLAEEMGYSLAPSPLQGTWACGLLVAASDSAPSDVRSALASGEMRGAVGVFEEEDRSWLVPGADAADVIVLGRRLVRASDASLEPLESLDPTRRMFRVRAGGGENLSGDLSRAEQIIRLIVAAESTGLAERCMEMAVAYAKERKQFDRPIGTYQAVSHRCAQMLLEVEGARALVYNAAWALDNAPEEADVATAMAKAYASDCGARVAASAIQVHGGIGFTWESDLHFFLKRAEFNAHVFGGAREMRGRVIDALLPA